MEMDADAKRTLIASLQAEIARLTETATHAAMDARAAATHEEARPENDKDTRAVEAAYLAGAQAERARDLARTSKVLGALDLRPFAPDEAISSSALVMLEHHGRSSWYFIAPEGGGMKATVGAVSVQVISAQSALGRELLGKRAGDDVEVTIQGVMRTYEVVTVV